ncbi:SaV-like [uncultured Caudovirales phage]|uniref:SaV-like n=1 Tax=uncultured Caudovirales phage TaxID=2100421 RepID=A0A6J5M5K7_9CAUD|nr:SaV-like [uncultured Caudovirales phage]
MTNKSFFKQVGGKHYLKMSIQPSLFINKNKLPFAEGNAIKYICRHSLKGKKEDVLKAIHYLEMIIERDYVKE